MAFPLLADRRSLQPDRTRVEGLARRRNPAAAEGIRRSSADANDQGHDPRRPPARSANRGSCLAAPYLPAAGALPDRRERSKRSALAGIAGRGSLRNSAIDFHGATARRARTRLVPRTYTRIARRVR